MIDISVIIPVYNREKYLRNTLTSLTNQTFKNFEVIIVDDGSTDLSCGISEEFCNKNSNWKLFKLEHKGVSHARIHGIKNSKGKYLSFVDSDDYVEPEFLETLFNSIGSSQIAMCNYRYVCGNLKATNNFFPKEGIFSRTKILKSLIIDFNVKSFLWNKLFERKLFDNIIIPEMCFEDKIMCLQLFYKIEKCVVINKVLYNYQINTSSMTWKMTENLLDDYIKYSEFLKEFLVSKNEYKKFKNSHKIYSIHVFVLIFKVIFYNNIIKNRNLKIFFNKLFFNYKRLLKSLNEEKNKFKV